MTQTTSFLTPNEFKLVIKDKHFAIYGLGNNYKVFEIYNEIVDTSTSILDFKISIKRIGFVEFKSKEMSFNSFLWEISETGDDDLVDLLSYFPVELLIGLHVGVNRDVIWNYESIENKVRLEINKTTIDKFEILRVISKFGNVDYKCSYLLSEEKGTNISDHLSMALDSAFVYKNFPDILKHTLAELDIKDKYIEFTDKKFSYLESLSDKKFINYMKEIES